MKRSFFSTAAALIFLSLNQESLQAQNQTETLSPVLPETSLPFSISINTANFSLPAGIQSYAKAISGGKWLLLAGRTNGVHGFGNVGNNFPPAAQNTMVYVVDPKTGTVWNRPLNDPSSGLSITEIDALSVTASEFFQKENALYIVGGYGIDTLTGQMGTKSTLTAINIEQMMQWVITGKPTLKDSIRQTSNPLLQVTGGSLSQVNDHHPMLLMLGQNFTGLYRTDSNGAYTEQVRSFWIVDQGKEISIIPKESVRTNADYRRRDLNIVPIIRHNKPAYTAYSGVFTLDNGVWTVPITIFPDGSSRESNPHASETFKQAMNQYLCPTFGLYSTQSQEMFTVFPGGISFGYFSGGVFETDAEIPFINQVTTIKIDKNDHYTQYLMDGEYPFIASTGSNPGNQLLFGASAHFFPAANIPTFSNEVIQLDALPSRPILLGYIVGGIMSTLPNTNNITDSTSSPYIFTVTLIPHQ